MENPLLVFCSHEMSMNFTKLPPCNLACINYLLTGNWQMKALLILPFGAAELSKVLKNEEALNWTWWEAILPEKDESASFSLQARVCSLSSSPLREWSCCLSAARKKNTSPSPEQRPNRGIRGILCLHSSVDWEAQRRKVCLGGHALAARICGRRVFWRAGGTPAVSGLDNELQVFLWVV